MSEMAREQAAAAATAGAGAGAGAGSGENPADSGDSKYKGVRKRKWGKWVSEIRLPNSRERIWLGSYDSAEKAARAFDAAQFCLRGRNARFNFPDDPPDIAGGRSLAPHEIQVAAARFANSAAPATAAAASASEPPRRNIDHNLSSEYHPAASDVQAESTSPSVSEGTVQMDCDWGMDMDMDMGGRFQDLLSGNMGSGNYATDYGLYSGYDEFTTNDYFGASTMPNVGFGDENFDGLPAQDSFLWNFNI